MYEFTTTISFFAFERNSTTWTLSKNWDAHQITPDLCISYRLFADDVGIFIPTDLQLFEVLKKTLELYEKASGARLNLRKSTMIPLGENSEVDWIYDTGCVIAGPGEVFKYLGAPGEDRYLKHK